MSQRPVASLSLDLDNEWSYMKTHGDEGWDSFPSFFETLVPRMLDVLSRQGLTITVFVVGQDAAIEANRSALRSVSEAGHEIGNHSFHHEPWLHLYTREQLEQEFDQAEEVIEAATGVKPRGFRGPGFSLSADTVRLLAERDYLYDASTFPTIIGPLARAYYFFRSSSFSAEQREQRKRLFGRWRDGFQPVHPYRWTVDGTSLIEIPVTVAPLVRTPIHFSYILYLARFSRAVAVSYFRTALGLCRLRGVPPSLLLHGLDFLGAEDCPRLAFFPAMDRSASEKISILEEVLEILHSRFEVLTMGAHAERLRNEDLKRRPVAVLAGQG